MRLWRRLSQAIFAGEIGPLVLSLGVELPPRLPDGAIDWAHIGELVFTRIERDFAPPDSPAGAVQRSLFAVFVYFEGLVFWENGVVHEEVRGLAHALRSLGDAWPEPEGPLSCRAAEVREAVYHLMQSVDHQFEVECALGTCCPTHLEQASKKAAPEMRLARDLLCGYDLPREPTGSSNPRTELDVIVQGLAALLSRDIEETLPYYAFLADAVAPVTRLFVDNLVHRRDDQLLLEPLAAAEAQSLAFETSEAGRRGVAGSESRAQRTAITEARRYLELDSESLVVESGSMTYVYPFGLPVTASGFDPLRSALRTAMRTDGSTLVSGMTLAGVRTVLDDTPQTDAWIEESEGADLDYLGIRMLFPDHELILKTSDGTLYRDLQTEVRLGGLGNHYVRVNVSTDTQVSFDGGRNWLESSEWSAHQLDQFIRRARNPFAHESVWFRQHSDQLDDIMGPMAGRDFTSFLDLATAIVQDLAVIARSLVSDSVLHNAEFNLRDVEPFLASHNQVIFACTTAVAVSRSGKSRRLETAESIEGVLGARVALMAQRPQAQSALEWLQYPPLDEDDRASRMMRGRIRREMIWCGGDTTAVFAPTLPNWMLFELLELIEFSTSLIGVYSRRYNWLRHVVDTADLRLGNPGVAGPGAADDIIDHGFETLSGASLSDLRAALDRVRALEFELDASLNHVQGLLDRSRNFQLSRDPQGRAVVSHLTALNGVSELRDALLGTVEAAGAQQRMTRGRVEHLRQLVDDKMMEEEMLQRGRSERPIQLLVAALTVFSFIDLFWWSNDTWGITGNHIVWLSEVVLLIGIAAIVIHMQLRHTKPLSRQEPRGATEEKAESSSTGMTS